jgi:L-ectoine synthase
MLIGKSDQPNERSVHGIGNGRSDGGVMIVRNLQSVDGTDRDVITHNWRSRRLLVARDGLPFSLHETVLYAGTETSMWYINHIEAVYCIDGEGELMDDETGEVHRLVPGVLYVLDGHEHHRFRAHTDVRTVCVFTPPVTGPEVHDETGAFPLMPEGEPTNAQPPEIARSSLV